MATQYYFPNYPYNDIREDPFLLEKNNSYNLICKVYKIVAVGDGEYTYSDCSNNLEQGAQILAGEEIEVCSTTLPVLSPEEAGTVTLITYDSFELSVKKLDILFFTSIVWFKYIDINDDSKTIIISVPSNNSSLWVRETVKVKIGTIPEVFFTNTGDYTIVRVNNQYDNIACQPNQLNAFANDESKYRHVFNSPDTSFAQPFLGNILKIENVIFGAGKAHFTSVKNNAAYKLLSKEAQEDALKSSEEVADISTDFNSTAMFTAYQAYLAVYLNGITRRNYGWSYNSIASYDYFSSVPNNGFKQRKLDNSQYLFPGVQSVGEDIDINNFQRESSVYLKTSEDISPLPFPNRTESLLVGSESKIEERSRFINSQVDCSDPESQFDISVVSYYGAIKNIVPNQWGQIYSYETIDTGFQVIFDDTPLNDVSTATLFGGDTYITKFGYKTKLPFFIDNRVDAPDDSDIFFDEIGNVAYPKFWHSSRSVLYDYTTTEGSSKVLKNVISIKAHYFDCPNDQYEPDDVTEDSKNQNRTFYDGKMYLFAYGIPYFYCESSVNTDLRQAFNDREGDFYPHVSTGIPDDWLQETKVSIANDNTYYYNATYSKQNKENFFSHLPIDWEEKLCLTYFPFRAVYSEPQVNYADKVINNWLIYRPLSYFDFPQNYGDFISIDGIQNKAVLARFENKSLLYNTLLTINTSNPQAAYLGNDTLFKSAPPIDFAETDLGFVGTQHKFILKIPEGQITIDAKRGQIFLIAGNKAREISTLGSGLSRFLANNLPFKIQEYYPEINIDNNFNSIGLHGVYDSEYNRVIITKLDYIPKIDDVLYDSEKGEFYIEISNSQDQGDPLVIRKTVYLSDEEYFCNKSWTLSYNLYTNSWISYHSYLPHWYIADNRFFYSGLNESCDLDLVVFEYGTTTTTSSTTKTPFDCELSGIIEEITTTTTTSTEVPTTTTTTTTEAPTTTTTTTAEETYTVSVYARLTETITEEPCAIEYSFNGSDWNDVGTFNSATCALRGQVTSIPEGTTLYLRMISGPAIPFEFGFLQGSSICPSASTNCSVNFVVNSNQNVAMNGAVGGGSPVNC